MIGSRKRQLDDVEESTPLARLQQACTDGAPLEVVRSLVEDEGAPVHSSVHDPNTYPPIALCALNDGSVHEYAGPAPKESPAGSIRASVIAYLRSRGASLDTACAPAGTTVLMACCFNERGGHLCTAKHVYRLLHHGADPNIKSADGITAIEYALYNSHGTDGTTCRLIVEALVRAGAIVNDPSRLLRRAYRRSVHAMAVVEPLVRGANGIDKALAYCYPTHVHSDPLGAMSVAVARYGLDMPFHIPRHVEHIMKNGHATEGELWAYLRTGKQMDIAKLFALLEQNPARADWWRVCARELGVDSCRHPATGDTFLHVAARTGSIALTTLMRMHANPLLRNKAGALPLTSPALRAYATWTPHVHKTLWYGPHFETRAVCFAWVCKCWAATHVRYVPRDVVHKVIQWIAANECTYIVPL